LARRLGLHAIAYKPVATGVIGECEDAARHAAALGQPIVPPTFSYPRAVSPHLAAREAGRPIELDDVRRRAAELATRADVLLVETAGGLFTPLGQGVTNVDLVKSLEPAVVVLVAPDRLGVLHDVTSCVVAAQARGLSELVVVLSAPEVADGSTGGNAAELDALGLGPVAGVFPRTRVDDDASQGVAEAVWRALSARRG
jgi:dethiobiotin synthetase